MLEKFYKRAHKKFNSFRLEVKIIIVTLSVVFLWMLSGVFIKHESRVSTASGQSLMPVYEAKQSVAQPHEIKIRLNGTVEASKVIELKAEATGYVKEIVADEGDMLEEGDIILILDSKTTTENLENAKFNVEKARVAFESALALFEKGLGSELKYFQAKSDLTRARADLARAQMDFEDTSVKMPFQGIVDHIYVETGDLVDNSAGSQDPVARVICTANYKVISYVPDPHIHKVKLGQNAEVIIDAKNEESNINGKVISVSQVANETIKTFDAEILLENTPHELRTGMGVYVEIAVGKTNAHKIPLSAITLDDAGIPTVRYIENNIVHESKVSFVDEDSDGIWISGLPNETSIVIMGASNLKTGTDISDYNNPTVAEPEDE